jgi:hypothetical protein
MAAQLGPYLFTSFQGDFPFAHQRGTVLPEQPGINGLATAYGGWVVEPVTARTQTYLVAAGTTAAEGLANNYRALHASSQILVLPSGRRLTVRVHRVEVQDFRRVVGGGLLVPVTWVFIPSAAP